jgi:hypothetical protein
MYGRYITELENFIRDVDIVNMEIWNAVMNRSFTKYLEATKIVRTASYLEKKKIRFDEILKDFWYATGEGLFGAPYLKNISDQDGIGHAIFALKEKKSIWVVDKKKRSLNSEDCEYTDLLKNVEDMQIPKFQIWPDFSKDVVLTSICIPDDMASQGVFNLELRAFVEPEEPTKNAVFSMAESIHLFYSMLINRLKTSDNTLRRAKNLEQYAIFQPHSYFISYASDENENAKEADHIEALLYREGRAVGRDVNIIRQGERISDAIKKNINDSDTFLALWSQHYHNSDYCLSELRYAYQRKKSKNRPVRVILLKMDETECQEMGFNFDLQSNCTNRSLRESNIKQIVKDEDKVDAFVMDTY